MPDSRQNRNVCGRAFRQKGRLCEAALPAQNRRKNAFLKNKAGELLKTKDLPKKQTENKAETKLAILLKTMETFKKQSRNKPENKAGHLVENKCTGKNKPETNRRNSGCLFNPCIAE